MNLLRSAFCFLLMGVVLISCQDKNEKSFRIIGTIDGATEGDTVMLQMDKDQSLRLIEQTYIKNNQFIFTGRQDSTVERVVTYIKNGVKMGSLFFLENGTITMKLSETSTITGTSNNDIYQAFLNNINGIYGQMSSAYNTNLPDSNLTDRAHVDMQDKVEKLDQKANALIIKTITENIENPVGYYLFKRYSYIMDYKLQYYMISKLPKALRHTSAIEDIKAQLATIVPDSIE